MSLHEIGAVDYGAALAAAGDLAGRAITDYQKGQAEEAARKAATAAEERKLAEAVAADQAWVLAEAAARTSAATAEAAPASLRKAAGAKAAADAKAADLAATRQARAGAGLAPSVVDRRVQAAEAGFADATAKLQARPDDGYTQKLVEAWEKAVVKAQNVQVIKRSDAAPASAGGNALELLGRPVVGPVKVWHVGAAVGGGGVLWLVVRKLLRREVTP